MLVGGKERREWPLETGLSGASREELRRLVELYLSLAEAAEARSKLAKRRMEASTHHSHTPPTYFSGEDGSS